LESLQNKNILITGGTSRLGQCFVRSALKAGARVLFTYHRNSQIAGQLESEGAKGFLLDLSDIPAIDAFAKILKEHAPVLHAVIHNAAAVRDHTIQNLTEEEWDYVMTVDLKAPYYLTKKTLPQLFKASKENGFAKVFFVTSRAAVTGGIGISNYAAAKAGLIALAKSLAQELGKKNILVNAVNPGFMKSAMTESLPEQVIQNNTDASPLGRISDPGEVAGFLCFLCSDAMKGVSGQTFHFESRKI
jgi:3-oxoacyl-[acyl-carrier protein] reductase